MLRKAPWNELLLHAGGTLLFALLTVVFIPVSHFPTCISALFCIFFMYAYFHRLYTWLKDKPTFVTSQGVSVWTGGIYAINKERMEQVLDFYIENLPKLTAYRISAQQLRLYMRGMRIEWTRRKLRYEFGWKNRDPAGYQSGRNIKLRFTGKIYRGALFHQLHHMIDEVIFKMKTDKKHTRGDWWNTVGTLKISCNWRV